MYQYIIYQTRRKDNKLPEFLFLLFLAFSTLTGLAHLGKSRLKLSHRCVTTSCCDRQYRGSLNSIEICCVAVFYDRMLICSLSLSLVFDVSDRLLSDAFGPHGGKLHRKSDEIF